MSLPNLVLTDHALLRCAQRNVYEEDILLAIRYGERLVNAGNEVFFLGRRHLAQAGVVREYARLEGLTVHADRERDGSLCIITVYRDKDGLSRNRRKAKYNLRPPRAA